MTVFQFSVILISYDQRSTVLDAAHSVLTSLGTRGELICVDDGSTDGTAAALDILAAHDPRVHVLHVPHSGKPSVSRNAGLAAARGEWISFLDGDDLFDARRCDVLAAVIDAAGVTAEVLCHNHLRFTDGSPPSSGEPRITPELESEALAASADGTMGANGAVVLDGNRFGVYLIAKWFLLQTSSICVRRSVLEARGLRFNETRVFGEDHPFLLSCILGSRVIYVPECLTLYRKHERSLTAEMTPAAHAQQLLSFHEQADDVTRRAGHLLTDESRAGIRRMLLEATLHHGYLLERAHRRRAAVGVYLRAGLRFMSGWALLRAGKALLKAPRPAPQPVRLADSLTK